MKWIVEFAQIVLIQIFCNILRLRLFKIIVEVFNCLFSFGKASEIDSLASSLVSLSVDQAA